MHRVQSMSLKSSNNTKTEREDYQKLRLELYFSFFFLDIKIIFWKEDTHTHTYEN